MKPKAVLKVFLVIGFLIMFSLSTQVMAGFEDPTVENEKEVGPTLWGVGVIQCGDGGNNCNATIRVKKVEDCVVSTEAVDEVAMVNGAIPSAPAGPEDVMGVRFTRGAFFNLDCVSVITKVKNWYKQAGKQIYSFDAQIRYYVYDDSSECQ